MNSKVDFWEYARSRCITKQRTRLTRFYVEMAPPNRRTETSWDHEYNTLRREKLFRSPPKDHTAYPALQEAVDPHIHSFNAIFRGGSDTGGNRNLLEEAIAEIGPKTFLDGDERAAPAGKNRLTVRYKSVTLQKSQVPPSNKFAKNREILPSECRERHVSYRGKLSATLEFRINEGDPVEFVRDLGQLPIMVKVRISARYIETLETTPKEPSSSTKLGEDWYNCVRLAASSARKSVVGTVNR